MKHDLQWQTAAPVWSLALQDSGTPPLRFDRPTILRFTGDDFMDRLAATLAGDASRLSEFAVRQETWRTPAGEAAGWLPESEFTAEDPPKLYQPAHNRFYLITGGLVCRTYGLPDRLVDPGKGQAAALVMRRLAAKPGATLDPKNPDTYDEQAWVGDRQRGAWLKVANPDAKLADGEERLPLFPSAYKDRGRTRRLWAGLIPVGGREVYEGGATAPGATETADDPLADPRAAVFQAEVIDALTTMAAFGPTVTNLPAQTQLGFTLISFSGFLQRELPGVWNVLTSGPVPPGAEGDIVTTLRSVSVVSSIPANSRTWASLLATAGGEAFRTQLFAAQADGGPIPSPISAFTSGEIRTGANSLLVLGGGEAGWLASVDEAAGDHRVAELEDLLEYNFASLSQLPPSFGNAAFQEKLLQALLPLAAYLERELNAVWLKIANPAQAPALNAQQQAVVTYLQSQVLRSSSLASLLAEAAANRDRIEAGIFDRRLEPVKQSFTREEIEALAVQIAAGGLETVVESALAAGPVLAPPAGGTTVPQETYYVARLVYEHQACHTLVISKPSRPFRLAGFFDPDAPVRPTRIRLPVDTSFEGLSKFPKAVTMLMSDQLRRQTAQARGAGLDGLIDGSSGSDPGPGLGLICSFSIPIITICAMILLMIIVQLLNIVFWWIPLFRICLPLPLKAKP